MRGGKCGCAGRCPRRTRVWSRCRCPRACGKGRRGQPHHAFGSCLLQPRPRLLTDSNLFTTGPSVPRLPSPGWRVCLPTRSSCQAPPSAHHMEGQACKARRDTRGQALRRRPGPAPGKCRWANGGGGGVTFPRAWPTAPAPLGVSPRSSDISSDTCSEPGIAARAPGHTPGRQPAPTPHPGPGQFTGCPGPRPRGRPASLRLSHLNLAHARPAARHRWS